MRRKRNEEFQKGEEVKVEEVALNEIDQKFMNDALAAVEKNMSNEEYDIDAFASDVCMSRSTLYRKIVSLTGQKPSEFIRTIRLKHAARLMLQPCTSTILFHLRIVEDMVFIRNFAPSKIQWL